MLYAVLEGDVPSPANKGGGRFVACIKVPSGAGNTVRALPVLVSNPRPS